MYTDNHSVLFQINVLSEEIYMTYFENKMNHMRPVVAKLKVILNNIDSAVSLHNDAKSVCYESSADRMVSFCKVLVPNYIKEWIVRGGND